MVGKREQGRERVLSRMGREYLGGVGQGKKDSLNVEKKAHFKNKLLKSTKYWGLKRWFSG